MSSHAFQTKRQSESESLCREEAVVGFSQKQRTGFLEALKTRLDKSGWELIEYKDKGFAGSFAKFRRFRKPTRREALADSLRATRSWIAIATLLWASIGLTTLVPNMVFVMWIPICVLGWIGHRKFSKLISIYGLRAKVAESAIAFAIALSSAHAALSLRTHIGNEQEASRAQANQIYETNSRKQLETAKQLASSLKNLLRNNNIDESVIIEVGVDPQTRRILIQVSNAWLSWPEYQQKQIKKTIKLLIEQLTNGTGHPFQIIDYLGTPV